MGMQLDVPAAGAELGAEAPPLVVEGVEITQAVQNMAHDVRLIADKQTVVRVYLGAAEAAGPLRVRGEIDVDRGSPASRLRLPSAGGATVNPSLNGDLTAKRERVEHSLNFPLPDAAVSGNRLTVRVVRVTTEDAGVDLPLSGALQRQVDLHAAAPLRVRVIGLRYEDQTDGTRHEPRAMDYARIRSWLRRAYPVAEMIFSQTVVDANFAPPMPRKAIRANAQISAMRAMDVGNGVDPRTHYYGLVWDAGGRHFMRGRANGIPPGPDPSRVASGPAGAGTFGWDSDGSYADWYTGHELAHTLGRFHPGFCNNNSEDDPNYPYANGQLSDTPDDFLGFDVGDEALGVPMRALPGTDWHDVMTYCERQWLSAYSYEGVFRRLAAEEAAFAPLIG